MSRMTAALEGRNQRAIVSKSPSVCALDTLYTGMTFCLHRHCYCVVSLMQGGQDKPVKQKLDSLTGCPAAHDNFPSGESILQWWLRVNVERCTCCRCTNSQRRTC